MASTDGSKSSARRGPSQHAGGSKEFNLWTLRRLFNQGNQGKGTPNEITRFEIHTTITQLTNQRLVKAVPTGRGGYSAPVVEIGIHLVLAAVGKYPLEKVAEELVLAVKDKEVAIISLQKIAALMDSYTPVEK